MKNSLFNESLLNCSAFHSSYFPILLSTSLVILVIWMLVVIVFISDKNFAPADKTREELEKNTTVCKEGETLSAITIHGTSFCSLGTEKGQTICVTYF